MTGRRSRPVITPHGKVVEEIEARAFEQAINRAGNITVTVDHDNSHVYASTEKGTLKLYEDNIGLHADTLITDDTIVELAKKGKIKGWSFGMYNVQDEVEARADELPVRKIKSLDLDHITLVIKKNPVYSATSVEVRADGEVEIEVRAAESGQVKTKMQQKENEFDNSEYRNRVNALNKEEQQ